MAERIISQSNGYEKLLCYKKARVIYDLTYHFCQRFIDKKDHTFDQMVQAARSGKQNIVEGAVDGASSCEMALKLTNVARGSLRELLEDYRDYLRVRGLNEWASDSKEVDAMRKLGVENQEPEYFLGLAATRSDEVVANMVIVLLCQADTLIKRYLDYIEKRFTQEGGIKERLYVARTKHRGY